MSRILLSISGLPSCSYCANDVGRICTGLTIPHVRILLLEVRTTAHVFTDYEQQRHHLLHKYGIDLEDPNGIADGRKTKRLDAKQIELLMGGGDGQTGIFTWREKNKRKVG